MAKAEATVRPAEVKTETVAEITVADDKVKVGIKNRRNANMERQRINMDISREIWKEVGKAAIDLGIDKRQFVEQALLEKLDIHKNN